MASIDQNTAHWEVPETRTLTASTEPPRTVVVKMSRAYWGCFDFLVNTVGCHPSKLVNLAEAGAQEKNIPFMKEFPDMLAWMDQELSKTYPDTDE